MNVFVDKIVGYPVKLEQTKIQRDWMDQTFEKHAYKCFPVSQANTIGWSISFLHDIEFIWDGISDASDGHVKVLQDDGNVCNTDRRNGTISFNSGLYFKTSENMSILSISPPNYFIDGAAAFTSIVSTSFYDNVYPVSWKITKPNVKIKIPAGTPVATLIPLSISALCDIELNINDKVFIPEPEEEIKAKLSARAEIYAKGKFTNFYRDGVKHDGTMIGSHEKKSIKMIINDFTK
jgi:hypothetical protein